MHYEGGLVLSTGAVPFPCPFLRKQTNRADPHAYCTWTSAATLKVTGPNNPEGSSLESLVQCFQVANVSRPVGLGLPSSSHCGQAIKARPKPSGPGRHWQSSGRCS